MSEEITQEYAELTAKEALHRIEISQGVQAILDDLPDDPEAHRKARKNLTDQAEHYLRIASNIMDIVDRDYEKYSNKE